MANHFLNLRKRNNAVLQSEVAQHAPGDIQSASDLVISGAYTVVSDIVAKNVRIKSDAVIYVNNIQAFVIWAKTIVVESGAQINLDGKGWWGGRQGNLPADMRTKADEQFSQWLSLLISTDAEGWASLDRRPPLGYVPGYWLAAMNNNGGTNHRWARRGGDAPASNKPGVQRTIAGLANATAPEATNWGAGANGTNGAGGGGGGDGTSGWGGGSGAGSGGGSASNGSYMSPRGGNGSQADPVINLALLKNWDLSNIPIFGGGGGYGHSTTVGGNGGGSIQFYATDSIEIQSGATLSCKGTNGTANGDFHRAGGGGGGSIILVAPSLTNNGTLSVAKGLGAAGSYPGGDGGDGLILINTDISSGQLETLAPSDCFFDEVSKTFFQNEGVSGTSLVYGEDSDGKYITPDGVAFVNTGIKPNNTTHIEIEYKHTDNLGTTYKKNLCGVAQTANDRFMLSFNDLQIQDGQGNIISNLENVLSYEFGRNSWHTVESPVNVKNRVQFSIQGVYLNGNKVNEFALENPQTFSNPNDLYLFVYGNPAVVMSSEVFQGKIYRVRIWQNGVLVRNMRPTFAGETYILNNSFFQNINLKKKYMDRLSPNIFNIINTAFVPYIAEGRASLINPSSIYNSTGLNMRDTQAGSSTSAVRIEEFNSTGMPVEIRWRAYDVQRNGAGPTNAWIVIGYENGTVETVQYMAYAVNNQGPSSAQQFNLKIWSKRISYIMFRSQFDDNFWIGNLEIYETRLEDKIFKVDLIKRYNPQMNIETRGALFPGTLYYKDVGVVLNETDFIDVSFNFVNLTKRHYVYVIGDENVAPYARGCFYSITENNTSRMVITNGGRGLGQSGRWLYNLNTPNKVRIRDLGGAILVNSGATYNGKSGYPNWRGRGAGNKAANLFHIGTNQALTHMFSGILYSFTVADSNSGNKEKLKLDIKPVWDGPVLKLYDFISERFLIPIGTGQLQPGT